MLEEIGVRGCHWARAIGSLGLETSVARGFRYVKREYYDDDPRASPGRDRASLYEEEDRRGSLFRDGRERDRAWVTFLPGFCSVVSAVAAVPGGSERRLAVGVAAFEVVEYASDLV